MNEFDAKIIAEFLEANYEAFQAHLEEKEIDGNEAESIIDQLMKK